MSDEQDKTRIKPDAPPADADKTRIGAPRRDPVVNESDDKTRAAPDKSSQNDATRIAPPRTPDADATRIKSDDATRIAPPKTIPPVDRTLPDAVETTVPDPISSRTLEDSEVSTHSVLKERFVLEKVLGAGGMGVVYKAKDLLKVEANDRDPYVAIKVLSEEFKAHPEAFIALQRESRKSQRIAHPNIVTVFDFDRDGDTVFMTMEYMEGRPLDKLIQQYKSTGLPTEDATHIVEGMCAALGHAHNEKIIHSDFKPGNVFVTDRGSAKVFDFGIARAVAQVEQSEEQAKEDRTVFDAGNLGALTPAYASMEMLLGETPDVRDDLYALGCVAYEMYTGQHPFNKTPADEAFAQKLKPKRIPGLAKSKWQAIEKALAFKREDRVASIDEFLRLFKFRYRYGYQLAIGLAVLLSVSIFVYFQYFNRPPAGPDADQIRNELEYQIRVDFYRDNIERLIADNSFSEEWESELWSEVQGLMKLVPEDDAWLAGKREIVYRAYLNSIDDMLKKGRFRRSEVLIGNAARYTSDSTELDAKRQQLAEAVKLDEQRKAQLAAKRKQDIKQQVVEEAEQEKVTKLFDVALDNVNQQLKCQSRPNMRNLDTAIKKLRSLDTARYRRLEPNIVKSLAACIEHIGKSFPDRAVEAKRYALRMFSNHSLIAAIEIRAKDPCDQSIAGLGARGQRTQCRDRLQQAGNGPSLVVIPGSRSVPMFAIGKYEVMVDELNAFCSKSSVCSEVKNRDTQLPVTNVSFAVAREYMKWLSRKSGRKYRLPTKAEWEYAARSRRLSLDPNRNCQLQSRGIQKGGELVKVTTGRQNGWGLVNYAGNAREWVYDKGRKLVAVGGSYADSMDICDINNVVRHDGSPDAYTGFRVLREIDEVKP
jgi:serine/threonine protein kinase